MEWHNLVEDWVTAGRHLLVIHYEQVSALSLRRCFSKMTQRWSKTLWPVWRTFSTFSNYVLTREGPLAFPTLTSRCKREEHPFQNHPFQVRQQKRWWENITTSVHLNLQQNFSHQVLEAMKTVDTLLISYNHPGLPWTSYNLPFWMTS